MERKDDTKGSRRWSWFSRTGRASIGEQYYRQRVRSTGSSKASESEGQERERMVKIVVMGDKGCGKSAVIDRYCLGLYNVRYRPTVGPEVSSCSVGDDRVPGAEQFVHPIRALFVELPLPETRDEKKLKKHLSDADAILLIADLTQPYTTHIVDDLLAKAKRHRRADVSVSLFLHKSDRKSNKIHLKTPSADLQYARCAGIAHIASTTALDVRSIEHHVSKVLSRLLTDTALISPSNISFPDHVGRPALFSWADCRKGFSDSPLRNNPPPGRYAPPFSDIQLGGRVEEEQTRHVESNLLAFLNLHSQYLGDYKKPLLSTSHGRGNVPTGTPSQYNQTRADVSSCLELELQRECERLFARLRQLQASVRKRDPSNATIQWQQQEFLYVTGYLYAYLVPWWGSLANEMIAETTMSQAKGMAKVKSVVSNAMQHAVGMVQPPAVFNKYLREFSEIRVATTSIEHRDREPDLRQHSSNSLSSDSANIQNTAGSGSSFAPVSESFEGLSNNMLSSHSAFTKSLSMVSERAADPSGSPITLCLDRRPALQADREFLKALSHCKLDLRHLKDLLTRDPRLRHNTKPTNRATRALTFSSKQEAALHKEETRARRSSLNLDRK